MRTVPAFWSQPKDGGVARFEGPVAGICLVVLIAALRALMAERRRVSIERLKAGEDPR